MLTSLLWIPNTFTIAIWIAVLAVLFTGSIFYVKKQNKYFPDNGFKSVPVYIPFFGNLFKVFMMREHVVTFLDNIYHRFHDEKYFGLRHLTKPVVVLRDLELIKQIGIKDFDQFVDHVSQVDESIDPLFGNSLVALTGQKWRDMRATLSPAFTSSKMKNMFEFISECGAQAAQHFLKESERPDNKNKDYVEVDLKEIFTRYANDVIATSAFGINVNSFENRDNEFYSMGKSTTEITFMKIVKTFAIMIFPRIVKIFKISILSPKVSNFFRDLVNDSMKQREEKGIIRHDMIHLLMEAKKGSLKHETKIDDKDAGFATVEESDMGKQTTKRIWSNDDMVAQAFIFFFAGFDTSSTLLSFVTYELTRNPDVQKKLQKEIDEVAEKNNGKVKYEDLQQMKYMDMVVSETLRYWPPAPMTDRKCLKPYTLPPSNKNDTTGGKINVGVGVWFPIHAIHHDPKYYKNPEKFDPERFSDENKHEINPLAYMPFGVGPRNCIGSRFALMEVKSIIFHLLLNFNLVVTEKTMIPYKLELKSFNMIPKQGFWIGLNPRKRN